jgi:hypothetical protein
MGLIAAIVAIVVVGLGIGAFFVFQNMDLGIGQVADAEAEEGEEASAGAAEGVGTLTLELTPPDASVSVDGTAHPGNSPRVISGLSAGNHKIVVDGGGSFLPFEQDVQITGGQSLSLPVKLHLRDVVVNVTVDPPNTTLSLVSNGNSVDLGTGNLKHQLRREPGVEYLIQGRADGFQSNAVPVVFDGSGAANVTVSLIKKGDAPPTVAQGGGGQTQPANTQPEPKPQPANTGGGGGGGTKKVKKKRPALPKNATLKIGTNPGLPPATIIVDGKSQGKKPVAVVKVSAGKHKIQWKWDDGKKDTQTITIAANETKVLRGKK